MRANPGFNIKEWLLLRLPAASGNQQIGSLRAVAPRGRAVACDAAPTGPDPACLRANRRSGSAARCRCPGRARRPFSPSSLWIGRVLPDPLKAVSWRCRPRPLKFCVKSWRIGCHGHWQVAHRRDAPSPDSELAARCEMHTRHLCGRPRFQILHVWPDLRSQGPVPACARLGLTSRMSAG